MPFKIPLCILSPPLLNVDEPRRAFTLSLRHYLLRLLRGGLSPKPPSPKPLSHFLQNILSSSNVAVVSCTFRLQLSSYVHTRIQGFMIFLSCGPTYLRRHSGHVLQVRTATPRCAFVPAAVAALAFFWHGDRDFFLFLQLEVVFIIRLAIRHNM